MKYVLHLGGFILSVCVFPLNQTFPALALLAASVTEILHVPWNTHCDLQPGNLFLIIKLYPPPDHYLHIRPPHRRKTSPQHHVLATTLKTLTTKSGGFYLTMEEIQPLQWRQWNASAHQWGDNGKYPEPSSISDSWRLMHWGVLL